ncbi:hypothetical protein N783_15115 [Pontibacillus marinus BH030004 = DSM 16465]|uniref:Uncharacterized protein n=1 Tax=Pontibacillus marinus BH030004 = DSM 16465 TaxID=1385511 RepID=A0A0A5G282_9BACI|nr:hypothetical protein N783_15115 [Pontibacillus marinus BH030004 = DSM 16465]
MLSAMLPAMLFGVILSGTIGLIIAGDLTTD